MLDPKSYADSIIINAMAVAWKVRITVMVVSDHKISETHFHHEDRMDKVDFVFVYNGQNHYSAAGENNL